MTLLDVAESCKIPLQGLEVAIDSKMAVVAPDSKLSWERRFRISGLRREIKVTGPVTAEQRDLLLRGAEACPVDATLRTSVRIETVVTHET